MKHLIPITLIALVPAASLSGANPPAPAAGPLHRVKVLTVDYEFERAPRFPAQLDRPRKDDPRLWLRLEAEVEVETHLPNKFIPELTATWRLVVNDAFASDGANRAVQLRSELTRRSRSADRYSSTITARPGVPSSGTREFCGPGKKFRGITCGSTAALSSLRRASQWLRLDEAVTQWDDPTHESGRGSEAKSGLAPAHRAGGRLRGRRHGRPCGTDQTVPSGTRCPPGLRNADRPGLPRGDRPRRTRLCPAFRCAIASDTGLVLVHTDRVLKDLTGFPQKYFRSVSV